MTSTFFCGWGGGRRWPRSAAPRWSSEPEARIRWLEEHQRDLEQRAADVADRVRDLRQPRPGAAAAEADRTSSPRRPGATAWWPTGPGPRRGRVGGAEPPRLAAREVDVGDGRQLLVHELAGPAAAATLLLLHGWGGTAMGNWATTLPALARHFRVVAPDLPAHDREVVDDLAALVDVLGLSSVIPVGYSLGSAVAYELWRRHPDTVDGLVLCAPAGVAAAPTKRPDVPVAVVVTEQDRLIPARRQLELARSLPGASVHRVAGGHLAFASRGRFVPALLEACRSVTDRRHPGGIVV